MCNKSKMKVGQFVFERIKEAGADHIFGVPGDFNLGLLNVGLKSQLEYVGTCNELNAAYAADSYARLKGLGACLTTYAVGELSAANGIAGAFAESVPVVMVVGSPARQYYKNGQLLHHTMGDYMIPQRMYEKITAAQTLLDNPESVVEEVDRVLRVCLREKKPVYISIPSDVALLDIEDAGKPFQPCASDSSEPATLKEAVKDIVHHLAGAKAPLLLPGIELVRRGLEKEFSKLVNKTNIPFATMLLCKGILDEDHDRFIGLYSGKRSRPEVYDRVHQSDVIVVFGEKMTDFNTGGFTTELTSTNSIYVGWNFVRVNNHYYHDVYIHDVIHNLVKMVKPFDKDALKITPAKTMMKAKPDYQFPEKHDTKLTMDRCFHRAADMFKEGAIVIAETGASLFSAAELILPEKATFMTQTFYGSIGYTVGAMLGACIATKDSGRPIYLFVGDGSFQVTAQDLSTVIRHGCKPYVFIINNDGYTIERTITDNVYNDIFMWRYAEVPYAFGGERGLVIKTEGDLEDAIQKFEGEVANNQGTAKVFEICLDRMDCSELLKAAGKLMAHNNKLDEPY